jgi:hypothetical protein
MKKKKETVGAVALDLMQKTPESRDPIEIQKAMQEDYLKELVTCVDIHKPLLLGNFFIVVITKNEKLMPNVFRNYFSARQSCPTPDYDQSVFKYDRSDDCIEYIWTIPSKDACYHLKDNALLVAPQERQLLKFVLEFADGTLYKLCKKLNNEEEKSPFIVKG